MYRLSKHSLSKLDGVVPELVDVVKKAIELTEQDFSVIQGKRSLAEQKANVAKGVSQTMHSRHLTGDAVDVAAYSNGSIDWDDLHKYATIAEAFRKASCALSVPIRWGGCWKRLDGLTDCWEALQAYSRERQSEGRSAFIDAGHFEIPRT